MCEVKRKNPLLSCVFFVFLWVILCGSQSVATSPPAIYSQTAIVIDADTGKVLYEKYPDAMMVPASMTKLMTVYLTLEEIEAGRLSYDSEILVNSNYASLSTGLVYFPGYAISLLKGNYETVDTLFHLIFQQSASVPCLMLAEEICDTESEFVERMNATAQRFSMDAIYENSHGAYTHYLTARAQARLSQLLVWQYPEVLELASQPTFTHRGITYGVISQLVNPDSAYYLPEVTGLKIGGTTVSGICLTTTVERDGAKMIVVTMKATNSNLCYWDHHTLIDYGFQLMSAEDYAPFHDVPSGDLDLVYQALREEEILLQTENGWVRPFDQITVGEFSVSLVSALESLGLWEKVPTVDWEQYEDLENYLHKDLLFRGLSGGILPTVEGNVYGAEESLTQGHLAEILQQAQALLRTEDTSVRDYAGMFSIPEDGISRGDAMGLLVKFLQDLGCFSELDYGWEELSAEEVLEERYVSQWAENLVAQAESLGIIPADFPVNYGKSITRLQITELLVGLVERVTDLEVPTTGRSVFLDTEELAVEKAVYLGIIGGVSETLFAPNELATRQELAVMFCKVIEVIEQVSSKELFLQDLDLAHFQDLDTVSSWASSSVDFVLENGIMGGMSSSEFMPFYHCTIEQCVAVVLLLQGETLWLGAG